jgi:hypothetical protein
MSTTTLNSTRARQTARSKRARGRDLARHARKCSICNHVNREAIEDDFLDWRSPFTIVKEYRLPHHTAIYRHAHATGLDIERRHHMRSALEAIIEKANEVQPTADAIVRAVCLYSQFDESGRWIKPAKTRSHTHISVCPEWGAKSKPGNHSSEKRASRTIPNSESGD